MQVHSINNFQITNHKNFKAQRILKESVTSEPNGQITSPVFKGGKGFGVGAVVTAGACLIGTGALALATLSNPIGWGTAASIYFGSIGASAAGGYAGHKIEDAIKKK